VYAERFGLATLIWWMNAYSHRESSAKIRIGGIYFLRNLVFPMIIGLDDFEPGGLIRSRDSKSSFRRLQWQQLIYQFLLFFTFSTPCGRVRPSSALSVSCSKNGDVPKSPLPPIGSASAHRQAQFQRRKMVFC
jgi:hypothetical protein